MSVGFVMLAHSALDRAAQVARVLSENGFPLVVHIDRNTPAREAAAFRAAVAPFGNVTLAPQRHCEWGRWSLVAASRDAARLLLDRHPEAGHVFLISGACLPIRPLDDLRGFLARHPATDYIESVTIGEVPWTVGGLSEERFTMSFPFAWKRQRRFFDVWVEVQRRIGRRRQMPLGMVPHLGSQWWCLTRRTLERIFSDPARGQIDRFFRRVWIPDESYFQTLVRHHGCRVESRSLTLTKFDFLGKPHVFYDDHFPLIRQSPAFFVRKVWPGAGRLYRAFLEGQPEAVETLPAPAHVDRVFSQAVERRTRGRPGLVMASRFPRRGFENGVTAAPYAVFQGFDAVIQEFPGWLSGVTGSRVHGRLFDSARARFAQGERGFAGALSDSAALRDYDPETFLRNLIWNTRGEHQSFQFGPGDPQRVTWMLAQDANASVFVISGAWAVPLLRSGRGVAKVRADAAALQAAETGFLQRLAERRTRARVRVWPLGVFLDRPASVLQSVLDDLAGAGLLALNEVPKLAPLPGLAAFLQALKNAGMNPHTVGEVSGPDRKPRPAAWSGAARLS